MLPFRFFLFGTKVIKNLQSAKEIVMFLIFFGGKGAERGRGRAERVG